MYVYVRPCRAMYGFVGLGRSVYGYVGLCRLDMAIYGYIGLYSNFSPACSPFLATFFSFINLNIPSKAMRVQ